MYIVTANSCSWRCSSRSGHETRSELGLLGDLLRKAATKVVRPRSDQGLRCTDKDRSEETEEQALLSAIKHIQVCLRRLYL